MSSGPNGWMTVPSNLLDKNPLLKAHLKKLLEDEIKEVNQKYGPLKNQGGRRAENRLPGIDRDPHYRAVMPAPGNGTGTETGNYVPSLSGASGVITGTVIAADEPSGPKAFYVGTVDSSGRKNFYQGVTDAFGHLVFALPAATNVVQALVFRKFDKTGNPDTGGAIQVANAPANLPDTQLLPRAPRAGSAITGANSSFDRDGPGNGLLQLQVRDIDPTATHVLLDGSSNGVTTLAASNLAVVAKLDPSVALGPHAFSLDSGGHKSNSFTADVIELHFAPLPRLAQGQTYTVSLQVNGVQAGQTANVVFQVSGAASLASGAKSETDPLTNGNAKVQIRANQAGALTITATVQVDLPDFRP